MEVANRVDAGSLIGWLNATDQWHHWAVKTLSAIRGPLHTTEIVLGEACWHLGGNTQPVHALLGLVRVGAIQLLHPWPGHLERTQEMMGKYDRTDAADASLVILSEIHRNAKIITTRPPRLLHLPPLRTPPPAGHSASRMNASTQTNAGYEFMRADREKGEAIRKEVQPCAA